MLVPKTIGLSFRKRIGRKVWKHCHSTLLGCGIGCSLFWLFLLSVAVCGELFLRCLVVVWGFAWFEAGGVGTIVGRLFSGAISDYRTKRFGYYASGANSQRIPKASLCSGVNVSITFLLASALTFSISFRFR